MTRILGLTFALCALVFSATVSAAEYEWKFALEEIDGSVQDRYAEKFAELMKEKTDGRVDITIYPYGSLGTSTQLTELIQKRAIQMAFASPGHLGSIVPEVQVLTIHFLFSDDSRVNKEVLASSDALYGPLAEAYTDKNLKLISLINEGWMVWTANKPLTEPSDFDGLKIRTMVSPLLLKAYEAYGANPTPMAYSEVYSGLQLGTIDAQVNPVFAIEEMSFYEQQDYMTFAGHLPFIASVVTNPGFYEELPDDIKQAISEARAEADDYIFREQQELNDKRLAFIKENSDTEIVQLNDEQRKAFRELAMPVREQYKEMAGDRGAKILDGLVKDIEQAEEAMAE
ncbi:TRAP transporter substrate-binding protein DctP [Ectothiorhodospiraceae bacterium WFHF3C12]|nr:TRAP transporter substrate-binding protein DctP [Ectothiorhodospiraceae bacterium WFHF3C12]